MTGRVVECPMDEMNPPLGRQQARLRNPPAAAQVDRLFAGSMNGSQLLYVLVDMQNLKRSERAQPLDRRPRRVPSRGALVAVLFGVVVLTAFGHITAFLLFLLAGIAVLAAPSTMAQPGMRFPGCNNSQRKICASPSALPHEVLRVPVRA
jgi:hypothetical protein